MSGFSYGAVPSGRPCRHLALPDPSAGRAERRPLRGSGPDCVGKPYWPEAPRTGGSAGRRASPCATEPALPRRTGGRLKVKPQRRRLRSQSRGLQEMTADEGVRVSQDQSPLIYKKESPTATLRLKGVLGTCIEQ